MIRSSTVTVCDRIPQHTVYSYVNCDKANRVSPFFLISLCLSTNNNRIWRGKTAKVFPRVLRLARRSFVIVFSFPSHLISALVVSTSSDVNCDVLFSAQLDA